MSRVREPGTEPPAASDLGRRRFLGIAGLATGTLAVAGGAAAAWYAVDRGVFATGTGPAYAAWRQAGPAAGDPLAPVRAAVLAANAHNTQPWLFRILQDRIDVFADVSRTIGAIDPLLRELHISLGCAIENLCLAAPASGLLPAVTLMPDPADHTHMARITLTPTRARTPPLFPFIAERHTNRAAYDTRRPVSPRRLARLATLDGSGDADGIEVFWFDGDAARKAFGELTIRATRAIIADERQTADDFAWYRGSWSQIQRSKDGVTIDPSGQPPLIRAVGKLVPTSRDQNNDGWLRGTADVQVPTAAAFGALLTRDPLDPVQRLRAGRVWQRMHLRATADGLAMQPLCQVPERIDRERSAGQPSEFTAEAARLLPPGRHPLMTFRVGHPTTDVPPSPRRPAPEVVLR